MGCSPLILPDKRSTFDSQYSYMATGDVEEKNKQFKASVRVMVSLLSVQFYGSRKKNRKVRRVCQGSLIRDRPRSNRTRGLLGVIN